MKTGNYNRLVRGNWVCEKTEMSYTPAEMIRHLTFCTHNHFKI